MKKLMVILASVVLMSATAWAGNIPEFDVVGCDNQNVFAVGNYIQYGQVIDNNSGPNGYINLYGDFTNKSKYTKNFEDFTQTAGQLFPDYCFGQFGLNSALTDAYNEAIYTWWITLQMKPESDINLNIYDCVLKHNEFTLWGGAEQTGRYRADWGQLFFIPTANPKVTAVAQPGPFATPGFASDFTLDARLLPGLSPVALKDALYTSKAHWSEGIIMVLPETGKANASGQTVYNLKQGDRIKVTVQIPPNNTADVRYGKDNVILKYIGIVGTWYYGDPCAEVETIK